MTPPDGFEDYQRRRERKAWAVVKLAAIYALVAVGGMLVYALLEALWNR